VQPPVPPVVRQRLVARIDDRPVELHPLVDVVHDVIRSLRDLEIDRLAAARHLEIERQRARLSHPPRPREKLPRREEREERPEDARIELQVPPHQVILVAAKRRARHVVHVVLDERHLIRCSQRPH